MPRLVGVHLITAREDTDRQAFARVMTNEVFDKAADVPGGVFRGGRSMIRSQHLLSSVDSAEYLWLVNADESLSDLEQFTRLLHRMYEDSRAAIEQHSRLRGSSVYVVLGSFDAGPRNETGGRLTEGTRGDFI